MEKQQKQAELLVTILARLHKKASRIIRDLENDFGIRLLGSRDILSFDDSILKIAKLFNKKVDYKVVEEDGDLSYFCEVDIEDVKIKAVFDYYDDDEANIVDEIISHNDLLD